MYKLLLSWRYLRTRYIALASIISVTLGVATLIVVNSVMAGFSHEMHKRLHGILSDIVFESPGLEGIYDPQWHMQAIRETVGNDLAGMTPTVRVPAMINFQFRGRWITQQVMLIGIDSDTYADVSDFSQYLSHPENRQQLSFMLRQDGYDQRMPPAGWKYRRGRVAYERAYLPPEPVEPVGDSGRPTVPESLDELPPIQPPDPNALAPTANPSASASADTESLGTVAPVAESLPDDPFAGGGPSQGRPFDEMNEQYSGIVLGIGIASTRFRDEQGVVQDFFLARPGDDVQLTLPTSGTPPKAVSDKFTVVDLYESKMSEYDSSFAFVPLHKLQDLRGMIDPASKMATVTSIQIKLKPGADLNAVRDKLRQRFPAEQFPYRIQTWRDLQGPLLAAVRLETTILNILLFLIIAVAGFGILATFFMIVVEKTRDIGILKALGAPSSGVMSIFLSYGVSLGMVGSGVGAVLGLLFVININHIAHALEQLTGREVFDPTVYYFQEIPTIIDPLTVVWVAIGSVLIAVLASVLPALRAARLHPVEALRYE